MIAVVAFIVFVERTERRIPDPERASASWADA